MSFGEGSRDQLYIMEGWLNECVEQRKLHPSELGQAGWRRPLFVLSADRCSHSAACVLLWEKHWNNSRPRVQVSFWCWWGHKSAPRRRPWKLMFFAFMTRRADQTNKQTIRIRKKTLGIDINVYTAYVNIYTEYKNSLVKAFCNVLSWRQLMKDKEAVEQSSHPHSGFKI